MQPRLDWKLAVLYTLLVLQVLVVMLYVASTPHVDLNAPALRDTVTFVDLEAPQVRAASSWLGQLLLLQVVDEGGACRGSQVLVTIMG